MYVDQPSQCSVTHPRTPTCSLDDLCRKRGFNTTIPEIYFLFISVIYCVTYCHLTPKESFFYYGNTVNNKSWSHFETRHIAQFGIRAIKHTARGGWGGRRIYIYIYMAGILLFSDNSRSHPPPANHLVFIYQAHCNSQPSLGEPKRGLFSPFEQIISTNEVELSHLLHLIMHKLLRYFQIL